LYHLQSSEDAESLYTPNWSVIRVISVSKVTKVDDWGLIPIRCKNFSLHHHFQRTSGTPTNLLSLNTGSLPHQSKIHLVKFEIYHHAAYTPFHGAYIETQSDIYWTVHHCDS